MVITATMMRPSDSELPFWNSSHTNFPSPGFCASISAAINTIQAVLNDNRRPVNIIGTEAGITMDFTWRSQCSRSTRLTLTRSALTEVTPTAVLSSVGHRLHSITVIDEVMNDFGKPSCAVYKALTTMVTSGNQASGETGLNN